MPGRDVALRGPLHHHARGAREHVAHARARPERDGVVAARLGVGALRALSVSARVDEARIDRAQIGGLDAQLAAHLRELVGDEHVGPRDEPLEHGPAVRVLQIQTDVALVAVHLLDEEVEVAGLRDEALLHHRAQPVALGPLDLHHVGAPVGEHGRGRRHEALLGDLEHAHTREHIGHGVLLRRDRAGRELVPVERWKVVLSRGGAWVALGMRRCSMPSAERIEG